MKTPDFTPQELTRRIEAQAFDVRSKEDYPVRSSDTDKPSQPNETGVKRRLEYLRGRLREECISYGGLVELQSLAQHIDKDDVELLEAAGVPEFCVFIIGNPDTPHLCYQCGRTREQHQ